MKILITGSSGLVGKSLCKVLKNNGVNFVGIYSKKLNLLNKSKLNKFLSKNKFDLVIHLAAKVGGININAENNYSFFLENNFINSNIISSCVDNNIKNFINIGSACMYPNNLNRSINEDDIIMENLEPTNEGYALSKLISYKLCNYINKKFNFNYKTIIPCNLYGPGDNFDLYSSHLVPAIITKANLYKENRIKKIKILGNGKPRREFMFCDDFADFLLFSINNFHKLPAVINCGVGKDFTVKKYYEKIFNIINGDIPKFVFDNSKPNGMMRKLLDISKIENLGWKAKTSFQDGIKLTQQYYEKNKLSSY